MIVDTLKNAELYYGVCPRMKQAFELLSKVDLKSLPAGKHILDGEDIFVNIMERDLKKPAEAKLEVHDVYADIQILLIGSKEGFGWRPRAELKKPQSEMDATKDVQFWDDEFQYIFTVTPEQFTILMPEDGHAPMIGEGYIKKAIVKVRI